MKSLFCFLICLNFLNAQVVTGHLVYKKCCESPLEEVSVNYLGSEEKFIFSKLDSSKIRHLLQRLIPDEKIITARGMSNDSTIEIFFAYKGMIDDNKPLNLITGAHLYGSYAVNNGFIAPYMSLVYKGLDSLSLNIAKTYPLRSFMVRNFSLPSLPHYVLGNGLKDGNLADMRNIEKSYRLVDYFKELNWKIIHYRDQFGISKALLRPTRGW